MTRGPRGVAVGIFLVVFVLSVFWTVPVWATDRYVATTGNDTGDCSDPASPCKTITYAIGQASAGDTIHVAAGTYQENVTINKNLKLISESGRDQTIIEGQSGVGALGTILIDGNTTGVQIGDTDQGFQIIGIDNGNPGIENGAIYIRGTHSGTVIKGNEIVANGDHGLVAEYAATISNFVIDGNIFSGETFVGNTPGGCGFDDQFTEPNVPRQLVVMGNGPGDLSTAKATNITFTNNQIIGTAGGPGAQGSGCEQTGQGNTLVTLDVANSLISHNTFNGYTTRYAHSLRVRRPNTKIVNNVFNGGSPYGVYIAGTVGTMQLLCNNIQNHSLGGVQNAGTGLLNAENNWWGCTAGPWGDACDTALGAIDYNPWLRREVPANPPANFCEPGNDADNDGLPDVLEMGGGNDQDRNTTTDPLDPDSDDDGLLDSEDENGNGKVDPGETDPNNWDTDGDNLCDGSASLPTGTACTTISQSGRNGEDLDGDEDLADRGNTETDPTKPDTDNDGVNDFNDEFPLTPGVTFCYGVTAYSAPSSVTYRPTARRPATRTIVVTIVNNSGATLTVPAGAFTPQAGEPFTIVRVSPRLPRDIRNGRRATFSVLTQVAAGQPPVTATAPYFNIVLQCGVLTSAGTRLFALGEIQLDAKNDHLRVQAHGSGIASLQVQLFDLSGRLVIDQASKGSVLNIPLATTSLANGVYLYVVRVQGFNGEEYVSEVRKLVIAR